MQSCELGRFVSAHAFRRATRFQRDISVAVAATSATAATQVVRRFSARLKACPDTKRVANTFSLKAPGTEGSAARRSIPFLAFCVTAFITSVSLFSVRRSAQQITFRDITAQAGIRFTHNNGAFGKKYLPETMGPGCAFIDYDNDGWPDILLVNGENWPGHPGTGHDSEALSQQPRRHIHRRDSQGRPGGLHVRHGRGRRRLR